MSLANDYLNFANKKDNGVTPEGNSTNQSYYCKCLQRNFSTQISNSLRR